MNSLLIKDPLLTVTMDPEYDNFISGWVFIKDNKIESIGTGKQPDADTVIDAKGMVLLPGLVNTHHHMYQTLTRNLPGAQDTPLFSWLETLYKVWGELTEEAVFVSAQVAMAELLLSGCSSLPLAENSSPPHEYGNELTVLHIQVNGLWQNPPYIRE